MTGSQDVERLVSFRKSLGLNQAGFAEKIGTTTSSVSRYEIAGKGIPYKFLKKMVLDLRLNANWVITGNGKMLLPVEKEEEWSIVGKPKGWEGALFADNQTDEEEARSLIAENKRLKRLVEILEKSLGDYQYIVDRMRDDLNANEVLKK